MGPRCGAAIWGREEYCCVQGVIRWENGLEKMENVKKNEIDIDKTSEDFDKTPGFPLSTNALILTFFPLGLLSTALWAQGGITFVVNSKPLFFC